MSKHRWDQGQSKKKKNLTDEVKSLEESRKSAHLKTIHMSEVVNYRINSDLWTPGWARVKQRSKSKNIVDIVCGKVVCVIKV